MKNLVDMTRQAASSIQINKVSSKDIAIIGVSLRFPRASTLAEFWRTIGHKVDCIGGIPEERRRDVMNILTHRKIDHAVFAEKAYLEEIDKFDYGFFGLAPKEAALIDPHQRIFLEVAWEALEDAGYGGGRLSGSNTGVYLGFGQTMTYMRLVQEFEPENVAVALPGNLPALITGRLAHILDLKGPNMALDTTCSSALVAVHYACQGIRNGECNLALAGAISLQILPVDLGQRIGIEAADGRSRTFDDSAGGTGSGEGAAVILLKPLGQALADGDRLYGVIKGGAVNHDGNSIGLTAPNPEAQEEVLVKAWRNAEIDPETISYIEAHGTGTKLGDPIEISAITNAFRRYTGRKSFCAIGSVKTNFGHLDSAAGLAGLLKALTALQHRQLPPTLHFNRPNRQIPFEETPVFVNDRLQDWASGGTPLRCGVSSFGMSGTNCHLVLEEAPERPQSPLTRKVPLVLTISAVTKEALRDLLRAYQAFLPGQDESVIGNVCYTAGTGRGHYRYRLAVWAENPVKLQEIIAAIKLEELERHRGENLFYGRSKPDNLGQQARTGIENETSARTREAEGKLDDYLAGGQKDAVILSELLELYCRGAEIAWDKLYQAGNYRRVALPVYPFTRRRCWILGAEAPEEMIDPAEESGYYNLSWEQKAPEVKDKGPDGNVLILAPETGWGAEMAQKFRGEGYDVSEVYLGAAWQKKGADEYVVTGSKADFDALLMEMETKNITKIIHGWALDNAGTVNLQDLDEALQRGVFSLLHFTQALLESPRKNKIEIILVAVGACHVTGREKLIRPENAAFFGLGKVAGMESPLFKYRCLDLDEDATAAEIFPEIFHDLPENIVAYREGKRYVETLQEVRLAELGQSHAGIREHGVYIITGGLGEIGLKVGRYLCAGRRIKLALFNRTPMPDRATWKEFLETGRDAGLNRKIRAIMEMEQTGSEVSCFSVDITSTEEMTRALEGVREKYGTINGIIHCAAHGLGREGRMLKDESAEVFRRILLPKLHGTWLLYELTRELKPDFMVMFSSAVTITGGIGVGAYTSANAYLDAFAARMSAAGERGIAIKWPTWKDTAVELGLDESRQVFKFIANEEALHALGSILAGDIAGVTPGRLNYDSNVLYLEDYLPFRLSGALQTKLEQHRKLREALSFSTGAAEPARAIPITGKEDEDCTECERKLASLWGLVLGITEVGLHDNFFDLGGHSLLAMNLAAKIEQEFGLKLELREMFDAQTFAEMASLLESKQAPERELEKWLDTLENISDEEARRLLEQEEQELARENEV